MSPQLVITRRSLVELRDEAGYSPEEMPMAMRRAGIENRCIPSPRTIRRAEDTGRFPQSRYARGLARFYGVKVKDIWPIEARLKLEAA